MNACSELSTGMVLAEEDLDAHVLHLVAGDHAPFQPIAKALLDGGHEVAGNRAADDRVDPEEVVRLVVVRVLQRGEAGLRGPLLDVHVLGQGQHADVDLAELPAAAGLLLVAIHPFGAGLDGFAVGDFRLAGFHFHLVAAFEPLADDLQVQLAHAGDDHLLGLRVEIAAERGVFLANLLQRTGKLAFVAAALRAWRPARPSAWGTGSAASSARPARSRCAGLRPWPRPRCRRGRPRRSAPFPRPAPATARSSFTPFRTPTTGTVESFFSVPEKTRMKLSFCTNGSMRVLNTWATSGPAGSAFTSTSSPAAFFAVRTSASGGRAQRPSASINSGRPTPVLPETQTIGNQRSLGHGLDDQPRRFLPRWAACPRSTRSVTSSSTSMIVSSSDSLISAGSTRAPAASAGGLSVLATPRKSAPGPAARSTARRPCRTAPECFRPAWGSRCCRRPSG